MTTSRAGNGSGPRAATSPAGASRRGGAGIAVIPPLDRTPREWRWLNALDDAPVALAVLTPIRDAAGCIADFRIEHANHAWRRLFGQPQGGLVGRRLYEALPVIAGERAVHAAVMDGGQPAVGFMELGDSVLVEHQVVRSGGSLVLSARDVTERLRAARALRASEERYRTLVEALDGVVSVRDMEAGTSWVSPQGERILGYPPGRLAEPGFWRSLVVPEDRARASETWDHDQDLNGYDLEYRVRRADGATIWLHERMTCVRDADGRALRWYGISFDITALKVHGRRRIRSARLEAIGQFASGVAHDFSDVLLGISMFNGFVRETLPEDDPRAHDLDQVAASVERGRALVTQLLAFARGRDVALGPIDPALIAREFGPVAQRMAGDAIEVHVTAEGDRGRVIGDRTQFEEILLNLVSNAAHAMPDGGRLDIEVSDRSGRQPGAPRAGWVRIVVRDTGEGMSVETAARIFEPFFTTREREFGTGLGLTSVHRIVESFGGTIDVTSAPGAGSSFEILLPRMAEEQAGLT